MTRTCSVLMAAYNAEDSIGEAIKSVLDQSFADFEFLVLDDASTDKTLDICLQYEREDSRVRVIQNDQNLRLARSLNKLLAQAAGEWVFRMDADDRSLRDRFASQLGAVGATTVDVLGSGAILIDQDQRSEFVPALLTHEQIHGRRFHTNPMLHPTVLMRKQAVLAVGGYDPRFRFAQDYDLWLRMMRAGSKFANLDAALLEFAVSRNTSWKRAGFGVAARWRAVRSPSDGTAALIGSTSKIASTIRRKTGASLRSLGTD